MDGTGSTDGSVYGAEAPGTGRASQGGWSALRHDLMCRYLAFVFRSFPEAFHLCLYLTVYISVRLTTNANVAKTTVFKKVACIHT